MAASASLLARTLADAARSHARPSQALGALLSLLQIAGSNRQTAGDALRCDCTTEVNYCDGTFDLK